MLKPNDLKKQIEYGLKNIYEPAIEQIILMTFPEKSDTGDNMAKDMAASFVEMTAEPMAEILSSAIDYYVKNITITGNLITTGSPGLHTCSITPAPNPLTAGKIPNTLGIS
jgi:hypothetical protein